MQLSNRLMLACARPRTFSLEDSEMETARQTSYHKYKLPQLVPSFLGMLVIRWLGTRQDPRKALTRGCVGTNAGGWFSPGVFTPSPLNNNNLLPPQDHVPRSCLNSSRNISITIA
jgi:hypothetical protein